MAEVPAGRAAVKPSSEAGARDNADASSKADDKRIEISKRLSWVLRRGARTSGLDIDDDGWVKVQELPEADCLKGLSVPKLLKVVEESNQQKYRYELRVDSARGQIIRAAGKKGAGGGLDEPETPGGFTPASRGQEQGGWRPERERRPPQEQQRGWKPERDPRPPQERGWKPEGGPQPPQQQQSQQRVNPWQLRGQDGPAVPAAPGRVDSPTSAAASPTGSSPKAPGRFGGAAPAPLRGPVPPGAVGSTSPAIRMPAAAFAKGKAQPSSPHSASSPAKVAVTPVAAGPRPPGQQQQPWQLGTLAKAGAAPQFPGAAAATPQMLAMFQQMQAMQQMMAVHAISSQYQMQVRQQLQELMRMRMLQQMQEMSYVQQMYAKQEMEAWFANQAFQQEGEESVEGFEYGQDGTGADLFGGRCKEVIDPSSMTAEELEAKIGEVMHQAQGRIEVAQASSGASAEGSPERLERRALREQAPLDSADLQAKIQEALQAAAERQGPSPAAVASAAAADGAATAAAAVDQDTMQAKVAEALAAARDRYVAASPPRPKKAAAPAAPASSEDLQAKIQMAVEAAKARTGQAS